MSDEFFNIRKSIFVKALASFDQDLIARIMSNLGQDYDDLYNSIDSNEDREYFDFMYNLYHKVDELLEKDNVKHNEFKMPDRKMSLKESIFIKALSRMDGDLLDTVLDNMNYGIEDIYTSLRSPDEHLLTKLMSELIKETDKLQKEYDKKNVNPDYEAYKKDPENPIWKTLD